MGESLPGSLVLTERSEVWSMACRLFQNYFLAVDCHTYRFFIITST